MNRKSILIFCVGWFFYAIAELVPLTAVIGVWEIYGNFTPQFVTGVPGGWFVYAVQFDKPLLMVLAMLSFPFFFWCFSYMKMDRLTHVGLYTSTTLAVILAIPDWFWNIGSGYYEILKYYSGLASLFVAFFAVVLYIRAWAFPEAKSR